MKRKQLLRGLVLAAAVLAADQALQYTVLRDGMFLGRRVIPFDPPLFMEWQRQTARSVAAMAAGDEGLRAASQFDAELGWCPRPGQVSGLYAHDWAGCRLQVAPLAEKKTPGVRRIVAVGCSFTQGAEVEGSRTWSALLDGRHADLEVANLGVTGYGIDQALLRFRRDGRRLEPDEVWLGFLPTASLRVTTQYPPALLHWSSVLAFKPMFALTPTDELRLVPSPARDYATFHTLLEDQPAFLSALGASDPWVIRAPAAFAPRGTSWMHWFAIPRLFVTWREAGDREPEPAVRDAGSEVYRLLRAIVLSLAHDARDGGARFRLLVLPGLKDLRALRRPEDAYWHGLMQDLAGRGIEVIEMTPALLAVGAAEDPSYWMPHEHYSAKAHELVAEVLESALGR